MSSLDFDTIQSLLKDDAAKGTKATQPQVGPLRYHEDERRCSSRGCGSMTHYRVQGAPKCSVHALEELNEMLYSAGFKGIATSHTNNPTELLSPRACSATVHYKLDIGWALTDLQCIHGISLEKSCKVCNGEISGSIDSNAAAARINA